MQYEQTFNSIDNILRNEAGCSTELDYIEQTSWLCSSSRWDRYLGMTAAMTQVPVPTATAHGYIQRPDLHHDSQQRDENAEQLGVSAVTVSKWCSNITQPTLPTLNRISDLLEVDPRVLLIGKD